MGLFPYCLPLASLDKTCLFKEVFFYNIITLLQLKRHLSPLVRATRLRRLRIRIPFWVIRRIENSVNPAVNWYLFQCREREGTVKRGKDSAFHRLCPHPPPNPHPITSPTRLLPLPPLGFRKPLPV